MILKKKTWPKFFKEIKDGKKNFEVRPGDLLILREWDPKTEKYTGRKIGKKVTYVLKTKGLKFFSKKDIGKYGYQIIGFR